MPLHVDISRLDRLVVIVARGQISADEMAAVKRQVVEGNVRTYAKIIDVSQGRSELTREEVQKIADLMRGAPDEAPRGPVAFVIDPNSIGFPNMFADITEAERPIRLFRSLHEARAWIERARQAPRQREAG
jgi:hypothetical protein